METVHFTDLKQFAERSKIDRSARYLMCHDFRDRDKKPLFMDERPLPNGAHAAEVLAVTGIQMMNHGHDHSMVAKLTQDPNNPFWQQKEPQFAVAVPGSTTRATGRTLRWHYASDNGMWDVPGVSYRNGSNYLLNVNMLLREGIAVDRTPIAATNQPPSRWL